MSKKYDLHIHSTCSDGTYTPKEIVDAIQRLEFSGFSITDHDVMDAYSEDLFHYAEKKGVEMIKGVELSSAFAGRSIHILGYFFNQKDSLIPFFERLKRAREERNEEILSRLKKKGIALSREDIKGNGRCHIACALYEKGYVSSQKEAFSKWIGDGKPCFFLGERPSVEETIERIHQAGGKSVLAHPALLKDTSLLEKLLQFPFDGIECFYGFEKREEMVDLARKKRKALIGGSDFHGSMKPSIQIGCSYTTEKEVQVLKDG